MNITLPKISKGVWTDNAGTVWMHEGKHCGVFSTIAGPKWNTPECVANAKACSAVPELLDALKEVWETLDRDTAALWDLMEKAKAALTKAGCTIS